MSRIPGEDYHPPHGAKATPPTVDAIARVLVDQTDELTALRSALAQQTERAERAETDRNYWRSTAQANWDFADKHFGRAERSEHALEATLARVRELRDDSPVHPDGYVIDRATLDRLLKVDQ